MDSVLYAHHDACAVCATGGLLVMCDFCDLVYHQACVPAMQPHQPTRGFVCVECYRDVLPDLADTYRRIFFQLPLDAASVSSPLIDLDVSVGPSSFSTASSLAPSASDMVASAPSSFSIPPGDLSTPPARLPPLSSSAPLVPPRVSNRTRVRFTSAPSSAPGLRADVPVLVYSGVEPGTSTDARVRVAPRRSVDSRDVAGHSGRHRDSTTRSATSSLTAASVPQILTRSKRAAPSSSARVALAGEALHHDHRLDPDRVQLRHAALLFP